MFNTTSTWATRRPTLIGASLAALMLGLVSCSSSPSPSAAGASQAAASQAAASQAAASQAAASQAAASQASAGCSVTPDATASATNTLANGAFGAAVTITAGQAVAFVNNDSTAHTITQGQGGSAASNACVDVPIAAGATVIVTFSVAGDYQITCKIHPDMQTQVHVT
jgi:plastocyanin